MDDEWIKYIIGVLVAAIGALWAIFAKNNQRMHDEVKDHTERVKDELIRCRDSHEKTQHTLIEFSNRIGHLEGQKEATEQLAKRVIDEVRSMRWRGENDTTKRPADVD